MFKKAKNFNKFDSIFKKKIDFFLTDSRRKISSSYLILQFNCNGENTKNGLVITFDRGPLTLEGNPVPYQYLHKIVIRDIFMSILCQKVFLNFDFGNVAQNFGPPNTSLYFSTWSFMRRTSIIRKQKVNEHKMTKTNIQITGLSWYFHFPNI